MASPAGFEPTAPGLGILSERRGRFYFINIYRRVIVSLGDRIAESCHLRVPLGSHKIAELSPTLTSPPVTGSSPPLGRSVSEAEINCDPRMPAIRLLPIRHDTKVAHAPSMNNASVSSTLAAGLRARTGLAVAVTPRSPLAHWRCRLLLRLGLKFPIPNRRHHHRPGEGRHHSTSIIAHLAAALLAPRAQLTAADVVTPTNLSSDRTRVTVRCRPSLDFVSVELAVRRSGLLPRGEVH